MNQKLSTTILVSISLSVYMPQCISSVGQRKTVQLLPRYFLQFLLVNLKKTVQILTKMEQVLIFLLKKLTAVNRQYNTDHSNFHQLNLRNHPGELENVGEIKLIILLRVQTVKVSHVAYFWESNLVMSIMTP